MEPLWYNHPKFNKEQVRHLRRKGYVFHDSLLDRKAKLGLTTITIIIIINNSYKALFFNQS